MLTEGKIAKKNLLTVFIFLLAVFTVFLLVGPGGERAAAENWQTFSTENFAVHYPARLEAQARKAAGIAEEVHRELTSYETYERDDITHMIIRDDADMAYGLSTPYLRDHIEINLSHPLQRQFGSSYESWLKMLIAHEYAHILHLNIRSEGAENLRRIFGEVPSYTYPNMMQPYWMLEGYAILAETHLTGGGRAEDAVYDMYIRTAFLEDDLYRFDQIHGQYDHNGWPPGGQAVYIYGASIFDYLERRDGKDKLLEVSEVFARDPGQNINATFYEVYQQSAEEIFEEWQQEMREKYQRQADELEAEGLVRGEPLTEIGFEVHQPALDPEGESIIYYHSGGHFPGLREYNIETGEDEMLKPGIFAPTGHSFTADGDLIYSRLDIYEQKYEFYDLYRYDREEDESERLTEGSRAHSPAAGEDRVYYITRQDGKSRVVEMDLQAENGESEVVIEAENGEQFLHLSLALDGDRLALVSWSPGGFQDLYIYDLENEERRRITRGREAVLSPAWTPEGNQVLFSSDRNGIYNLYSYDLEKEEIQQLTRELTGAFDPLAAESFTPADGGAEKSFDLYYTGYSERGFDIYRLDSAAAVSRNVDIYDDYAFLEEEKRDEFKSEAPPESRDYSRLDYMAPRYFFPSFFIGTGGSYAGITVGGRDPLNKMHYQGSVEYDGGDYDYPVSFDWNLELEAGRFDILQQSQRWAGRRMDDSKYHYRDQHTLMAQTPIRSAPFSRLNLGFGTSYLRDNLREDGLNEEYRGFSQLDYLSQTGRDSMVTTRNLTLRAGDAYFDDEHNIYGQFDWREFFEFPNNHRIRLRGSAAGAELEEFFELGGVFGQYPIRGYSEGDRKEGSQLLYFRGEYRFPLTDIGRGMGTTPVFFDEVSLAAFAEGGDISGDEVDDFMAGYGLELSLDMELSYGRAPARISMGIAGNIDESGVQAYLAPGLTF
ncbi:hypothetical protein [Halarsenatibacter silvermanii]|uniref:WD40-like Beta Propeller Repeat n=1 Tax=Halarsenatibacter silvermanii TaxID=321763 RepID=A0A1G9HC47_9FIRM|nr:hypothetical protein [Halarsenatibacter silvermanii]SDL10608.1 hypothetical protein SAMN04488692_101172 [Halarsenatibacter silvermanii]